MQNRKLNKIATALAVILLAITVFSTVITPLESNHHCTGEDCAICFVIQTANQNLRLLKLALYICIAGFSFLFIKKSFKTLAIGSVVSPYTLITQKIRLND